MVGAVVDTFRVMPKEEIAERRKNFSPEEALSLTKSLLLFMPANIAKSMVGKLLYLWSI